MKNSVKKKNALENEVYDLGQRVRCLEFNHRDDALEQYTRKFNVEVYGIPEYDGENLADHLREFFLLPHSVAFESYVKAFQFKVLNNILYTNKKLFKIGYRSDDVCTFCEAEPETQCPYLRQFWNNFEFY